MSESNVAHLGDYRAEEIWEDSVSELASAYALRWEVDRESAEDIMRAASALIETTLTVRKRRSALIFYGDLERTRFVDTERQTVGSLPRSEARAQVPSQPHLEVSSLGRVPAWRVLQRGVLLGALIVLISTVGLIADLALGLAGMYVGSAVFCGANYMAHRLGARMVLIQPRIALVATYGFLGLAATMLVAAF